MRPTNSLFQGLPKQSDIEVMESIKDRLALESEFVNSFTRTVGEAIPKLVDVTKRYFGHLKQHAGLLLAGTNGVSASAMGYQPQTDVHSFVALLRKQDFVNLMPLGIYVPEGFTGNLAQYAVHERKCVDHVLKLLTSVINPYNAYLSSLISSESAVKDSTVPNVFLKKVDAERDELNRDEGLFFRAGATHTRRPLGESLARMADWDIVFTQLAGINAALANMSNTSVQQGVDTCLELLDAVKAAATSGQFDNISPANVKGLASATLSIAREVEFYAATRQRVNVFNVAMDETSAFLKQALK